MTILLSIFIGGGLGSLARYGIGRVTADVWKGAFPMGTFLSNILACLVLALALYVFRDKIVSNAWLSPMILIGFCGGFSTFSTFSLETVELFQSGQWPLALVYVFSSVAVCTGLIWFVSRSVVV